MTLAQLRDDILERHRASKHVTRIGTVVSEPWPNCVECGRSFPCPEVRLATALSPENVAAGLRVSHHDAQWSVQPYGDNVPMSWETIATALLGAIPVDTQEGT